jgi:hypothetical protein
MRVAKLAAAVNESVITKWTMMLWVAIAELNLISSKDGGLNATIAKKLELDVLSSVNMAMVLSKVRKMHSERSNNKKRCRNDGNEEAI